MCKLSTMYCPDRTRTAVCAGFLRWRAPSSTHILTEAYCLTTHHMLLASTHAHVHRPMPSTSHIFRESQVLLNWDKVGTLPWLRAGHRDDYTVTFTTAGVRVERNGEVIGDFKTATERSRLKYTFDPAAAAFHMFLHVTTEPDDAWSGYQRDLVTNLKGGKN